MVHKTYKEIDEEIEQVERYMKDWSTKFWDTLKGNKAKQNDKVMLIAISTVLMCLSIIFERDTETVANLLFVMMISAWIIWWIEIISILTLLFVVIYIRTVCDWLEFLFAIPRFWISIIAWYCIWALVWTSRKKDKKANSEVIQKSNDIIKHDKNRGSIPEEMFDEIKREEIDDNEIEQIKKDLESKENKKSKYNRVQILRIVCFLLVCLPLLLNTGIWIGERLWVVFFLVGLIWWWIEIISILIICLISIIIINKEIGLGFAVILFIRPVYLWSYCLWVCIKFIIHSIYRIVTWKKINKKNN